MSEQNSVASVSGDYDWSKQIGIKLQVALAWVSYAEGRPEALQQMRVAADLDDAMEKHPVTPGALMPAREQLGELLLELKEPAAALTEFEVALRNTPNRFNALYGAARAARFANDKRKAEGYYRKLIELCRYSDNQRPELEEAKSFLAKSVSPRNWRVS